MKILILSFAKIKYMPYLNFYLDNLDNKKNEIDILYWNRDLKEEDLEKYSAHNLFEFRLYQNDDLSKIKKIVGFYKYKKFATKILKNGKYDFVICLHTFPAFLLRRMLIREYKNKFIFDYRDSTYEKFTPFKKIIGNLVKKSKFTFVSSDAFRVLLPESEKYKIYSSHNILLDSLKHRDDKENYNISSGKIRVAFWGMIRNEELNKKLIENISKDNRFELHYYGREQQIALNIKHYAKSIKAENVFFHGEYKPQDRYEFIKNTDIIHNVYNDRNMLLAVSNKFYDGIIFRIPQICYPKSYMGEKVTQNNIGVGLNPSDNNFTDKLFDYYKTINFNQFDLNCDKLLEEVLKGYGECTNILSSIN